LKPGVRVYGFQPIVLAERRHATGREGVVSRAPAPLKEPILLLLWSLFWGLRALLEAVRSLPHLR
jgi:hypothetical protein